MKTIYYYGIDNNRGGMETYAFNLIKGILSKTNEFKFHIITPFEDFAFKNELTNTLGCEFTILPNPKKHPFKYSKKLKTILSNKENSILHLNLMSFCNLPLLHAVKKSKIKSVVVGHSIDTNKFIKVLLHKLGEKLYGNIGLNVGMNERVLNFMFPKKSNSIIINNGIDEQSFGYNENLRKRIRNELNFSNNDFIIGQIGRLSKQKNQLFTCEVAKKINNKNIKFLFFGNRNSKAVETKIKKDGIQNIKIMGQINNIKEFYNAFDLLIMPSLFEAGSLALYEGLANQCTTFISPFVPSNGINSDYLKELPLKSELWVNEINSFYNNYSKRELKKKNVLPTLEEHINNYLNVYKTL